jgi:hypothetical protein
MDTKYSGKLIDPDEWLLSYRRQYGKNELIDSFDKINELYQKLDYLVQEELIKKQINKKILLLS